MLPNYRPICILPFFSKIIEKLIATRLTNYLNKFNILSSCQFGFRPGYSTDLALVSLTDKLKSFIDEGFYAGSVFIDLSKAFDTINHSILFTKLELLGICGPPLLLIKNYLRDRIQVVSVSDVYSQARTTNIGVPQGSILGPLLFLLYINDLPNCLASSKCLLYADDTTLYNYDSTVLSLTSKLNVDLRNVLQWCNLNKLKINASKTKFVVFHSHQRAIASTPSVTIDNQLIFASEYSSFLGVLLDSNLKYHHHIANVKRKMAYGMRILIKARSFFSHSTLISLYYSFINPHITYCISCWGNTYDTHLNLLQIIQNQAIRIISSSTYGANAHSLLCSNNILSVSKLVSYNLGIFCLRCFAMSFRVSLFWPLVLLILTPLGLLLSTISFYRE